MIRKIMNSGKNEDIASNELNGALSSYVNFQSELLTVFQKLETEQIERFVQKSSTILKRFEDSFRKAQKIHKSLLGEEKMLAEEEEPVKEKGLRITSMNRNFGVRQPAEIYTYNQFNGETGFFGAGSQGMLYFFDGEFTKISQKRLERHHIMDSLVTSQNEVYIAYFGFMRVYNQNFDETLKTFNIENPSSDCKLKTLN